MLVKANGSSGRELRRLRRKACSDPRSRRPKARARSRSSPSTHQNLRKCRSASRSPLPLGRGKEVVACTPNMTLGDVLAEVCKRRQLDPSAHALAQQQRGRSNKLDSSLTLRTAGQLSHVELVSSTPPAPARQPPPLGAGARSSRAPAPGAARQPPAAPAEPMEVDAAAAAAAAAAEVEGAALRGVLEGASRCCRRRCRRRSLTGRSCCSPRFRATSPRRPPTPFSARSRRRMRSLRRASAIYAAARQLLRTVGFVDTPAADATSERAWVLPPAADLTAVTLSPRSPPPSPPPPPRRRRRAGRRRRRCPRCPRARPPRRRRRHNRRRLPRRAPPRAPATGRLSRRCCARGGGAEGGEEAPREGLRVPRRLTAAARRDRAQGRACVGR